MPTTQWSVAPGGLVQALRHGATPRVFTPYVTRCYRAPGCRRTDTASTRIGREALMIEASELVDPARYPLEDPDVAAYRVAVDTARAQLRRTGAAEIPGFITDEGVAALCRDAELLAERAHASSGRGTAYLEPPDRSLPEDHPRLHRGDYAVRAVPYDAMPRRSPLRRLYEWDPLKGFVEAVLDRGPLYRYADPFGALNLAVMGPGDQLQWHFDQTDFVVSLAIQSARAGGEFEVAPRLRGPQDERYPEVARVLSGDRSKVQTLAMTPGSLLIFEGRHSLHRVSPVRGDRLRHVGLLAYDTAPGTMGSDHLRADRYGRTEPFTEPPEHWPALAGAVAAP
jgi:hypothetical protein